MTQSPSILLEQQIQRVFRIIDEQINSSAKANESLPFYDLNEMIKLEFEQCASSLRLSIKFKHDNTQYGSECDRNGNYFALLWMYKHRDRFIQSSTLPRNNISLAQLELFSLWNEDYEEIEGIDMNNIASIDAYTVNNKTGRIDPILF